MLKLLVLSLLFSVSVQAGPSTDRELMSKSALLAFQEDIGAEYPSGTIPMVGFSSIQENGIEGVDIFLANSPEDITAFRYLCDKLSTGVECTFHSMQARCFYYARTGQFTSSEIDILVNGVIEKHYYACQQEDFNRALKLRCESTSSPVGNPP